MKVGDLVKFKQKFRATYNRNLIGTLIAENGKGFDVLWSAPIDPPFGQGAPMNIQAESSEYLVVINENR